MYYKHTRLFGKRSPATVAMALDISQQFLILFWRPSPFLQTNLVATRSSSHACLVWLASSSSSSSSSSVPPDLQLCCDEIRAKLCLQVWTLDQEEGGEKTWTQLELLSWLAFATAQSARNSRTKTCAYPPPPSPAHTVCLYCQERQPLHHASCLRCRRFSA
jgi:hypothetical protein